jgi:hypothetical protein
LREAPSARAPVDGAARYASYFARKVDMLQVYARCMYDAVSEVLSDLDSQGFRGESRRCRRDWRGTLVVPPWLLASLRW